jgi:hypothetical protein
VEPVFSEVTSLRRRRFKWGDLNPLTDEASSFPAKRPRDRDVYGLSADAPAGAGLREPGEIRVKMGGGKVASERGRRNGEPMEYFVGVGAQTLLIARETRSKPACLRDCAILYAFTHPEALIEAAAALLSPAGELPEKKRREVEVEVIEGEVEDRRNGPARMETLVPRRRTEDTILLAIFVITDMMRTMYE